MSLKLLYHPVRIAKFLDIHIFEQEQMETIKLYLHLLNVSDIWVGCFLKQNKMQMPCTLKPYFLKGWQCQNHHDIKLVAMNCCLMKTTHSFYKAFHL